MRNQDHEPAQPAGGYPCGALEHLRRSDPVLEGLIEQYGHVERERDRPPFYALMSAIVGQQLSVKAAETIWNRFLALFEDRYPQANKLLMLQEDDLGRTIRFIAEMPAHVCINELVISPVWSDPLLFGIMVLVLMWRPHGLFGRLGHG